MKRESFLPQKLLEFLTDFIKEETNPELDLSAYYSRAHALLDDYFEEQVRDAFNDIVYESYSSYDVKTAIDAHNIVKFITYVNSCSYCSSAVHFINDNYDQLDKIMAIVSEMYYEPTTADLDDYILVEVAESRSRPSFDYYIDLEDKTYFITQLEDKIIKYLHENHYYKNIRDANMERLIISCCDEIYNKATETA